MASRTSSPASETTTPPKGKGATAAPPPPAEPLTESQIEQRLRALEASVRDGLRFQEELTSRIEKALRAGAAAPSSAVPSKTAVSKSSADSAAGSDAVDAVTASIRRAVSEALDRKLEELMGPAVTLHQRLKEEADAARREKKSLPQEELRSLLGDVLDEVETLLRLMGGGFIRPEKGEFYDPLIHLAVGQSGAGPVEDDERASAIVTDVLRPGYRSSRGRVVLPARVLVGRK